MRLVEETLDELMQIAAEKIALNEDSFSFISVWAELAHEYGKI